MSKLASGPGPLILIIILATMLRVWGLNWGLPSASHYFSYHPDETVVLSAAKAMSLFTGKLLPHFYNYGSLQLYLVNFANSAAFIAGLVDITVRNVAENYTQWARMYFIGRLVTVGMSIGTVWAVAALGTRLWGRRTGLIAAAILAIMPLHAQQSHWLTVDVPATFWTTLALLWAARVATNDSKPLRAALLAGVFAGLAAATKYNMALAILPLFVALWPLARTNRDLAIRLALVGIAGCLAAFLVGCPGAVLEQKQFAHDILFEAQHVSREPGETFEGTGNGFVYTITHTLNAGLGLPLLLLALVSIVNAIRRRERGDAFLAAFALPYTILISLAAVRYARYVLPLLPILAILTGRLLSQWSRETRPQVRLLAGAASGIILACTFGYTIWLIRPMSTIDTRDQAADWVQAHIPSYSTIAFPAMPWFQTASINPFFSMPGPGAWKRSIDPSAPTRILYQDKDWDLDLLQSSQPTVVIVSEYDTMDSLRLHNPAALAYLKQLAADYDTPVKFGNRRPPFGTLAHLPHDMLYPGPEIEVYVRHGSLPQ